MSRGTYEGEDWQRKVTEFVGTDIHNGALRISFDELANTLRLRSTVQAICHAFPCNGTLILSVAQS